MIIKQTVGRDQLGEFAPKFAALNDDVLFGEMWSREDRLSSNSYHLSAARKNGVTKTEIAEILTHMAFYAGW